MTPTDILTILGLFLTVIGLSLLIYQGMIRLFLQLHLHLHTIQAAVNKTDETDTTQGNPQ